MVGAEAAFPRQAVISEIASPTRETDELAHETGKRSRQSTGAINIRIAQTEADPLQALSRLEALNELAGSISADFAKFRL